MSSQIQELIAAEKKASSIVAEARSGMIVQLHHRLSMHKLSIPSAGLVRFVVLRGTRSPHLRRRVRDSARGNFSRMLPVYIESGGVIGYRQ